METMDSGHLPANDEFSMKVSFITTVLNEEKTIERLLVSLSQQTRKPDEIIIVDGGSTDGTIRAIRGFREIGGKTKIIKKTGNRAVGRNEAIKIATGEIIVMSDAGCELERHWVEEITKPFFAKSFIRPLGADWDVVAGYYQVSKDANIFQKCVACYALVPEDRVDPENFLPSSRSMAIRKSVFEKFGRFPQDFSDNEDYIFANRLKNNGAKIVFNKKAIVYWQPVSNLKDFFRMIFRFARGDKKAGLRKGKVATVFGRYAVIGLIGEIGVIGYLAWVIWKNYRYVKNPLAIFYLPVLQIIADFAIMAGTIL